MICQILWQACPDVAPFRSKSPAVDAGAEAEEAGLPSEAVLGVGVGVGMRVGAAVALGVLCGAGVSAAAGAFGDGRGGDGLGMLAGDAGMPGVGAGTDTGVGSTMYAAAHAHLWGNRKQMSSVVVKFTRHHADLIKHQVPAGFCGLPYFCRSHSHSHRERIRA